MNIIYSLILDLISYKTEIKYAYAMLLKCISRDF
jgi:hypothetical protein